MFSLDRIREFGVTILTNRYYSLAFWFLLALSIRLFAFLLIPIDWYRVN